MKHKLMTSRNTIDNLSYYYELQWCQEGCSIISRRFSIWFPLQTKQFQVVLCSFFTLYFIWYTIGIREADPCHTLH